SAACADPGPQEQRRSAPVHPKENSHDAISHDLVLGGGRDRRMPAQTILAVAKPPGSTAPVRILAFSIDLGDGAPFVRREFDPATRLLGHTRGRVESENLSPF